MTSDEAFLNRVIHFFWIAADASFIGGTYSIAKEKL